MIETGVTEFRRSSFEVRHRILKGSDLAVEGFETRVWTGKDPEDPKRVKGMPIPPEVVERFKTT
jgi:4-hydroxybenzoyl-CoA thioesterase